MSLESRKTNKEKMKEFNFKKIGGVRGIDSQGLSPLTDGEIQNIETKFKFSFPLSYQRFLKEYGAIAFNHPIFFNPIQKLPEIVSSDGTSLVSYFYGSQKSPSDSDGLEWNIDNYQGRMPQSLIAIGGDRLDSQICLGIQGEEYGKIYFWDVENEQDEEDYLEDYGEPAPPDLMFRNVYLIANSFEEFIDSLEIDTKNY